MRKLYYFISAAVFALGLASCNKENVVSTDPTTTGHNLTIIANTESSVDTKTYLSGDDATGYQVLWSEGDKIRLIQQYTYIDFLISKGFGTTKGEFVPMEFVSKLEEGFQTMYYGTDGSELSSTTKYQAGNMISSAPMIALSYVNKYGELSPVEFKNMCGLMRLTLKGKGTVKDIKVSADQYLSGEFGTTDGVTAYIKENGSKKYNYITQDCRDGVELSAEGTDFYISLPPNGYRGVKIEISDFLGNTFTKTLKSDKTLDIKRAQITPVSLTVSGLEHNTPGALAGVFTVKDPDGVPDSGDETKVRFSKGNLYWDGDSFEFEKNQSDRQTSWNRNHVSHFFYSRFADEACAEVNTYSEEADWIFTNDSSDNEKASGWFTVCGVTGRYRTLTYFEWQYLLNNHPHRWVSVDGVPGYVIAPDGVESIGYQDSYSNAELSAGNLVFLPAASHRSGDGIWDNYLNTGDYWTSSSSTDGYGCYMHFEREGIDKGFDRSRGFCIRLVMNVN